MKFVALVSGGKDSCYNILHCLKNGHQLVAMANLCPKDSNTQEIDSFMFQTVGHDLVSLYTQTCGVPLFRRTIGPHSSINRHLNYINTSPRDEIETMYHLLLDVKTKVPDVEAVSVGAILSSYQRVRVEDVCNRLGITVLSYLWQRDQLELMQEMVQMSSGHEGQLDARIIKVATIGLDGGALNMTLPQIFPTMVKLNRLYEVNICGEGGEFETMVLDAPFFKNGYLELCDVVKSSDEDDGSGVFNAQLVVKFKPRTLTNEFLKHELVRLPQPPLLNETWSDLLTKLRDNVISKDISTTFADATTFATPQVSIHKNDNLLYISNLTSHGADIETQTVRIFDQLSTILKDKSLFPCQILSSSLILNDMANFQKINTIYNNWFNTQKWGPIPPSRACVGSNMLPRDTLIQLSITLDLTPQSIITLNEGGTKINKNKDGLHVQGRSYWAPCNIGPYSQATWRQNDYHNQVSSISGQIALIPHSMELADPNDPFLQIVLSLRHFHTLMETISTPTQLAMTCFVADATVIDLVARTWELYCHDIGDGPLDCLIIVEISQLPKNALCEWGGVTCKRLEYIDYDNLDDDNDDDAVSINTITNALRDIHLNIDEITTSRARTITVARDNEKRYYTTGFTDNDDELWSFIDKATMGHIVLYLNPSVTQTLDRLYARDNIELYPVKQVYDSRGNSFKYGYYYTC